MSSKKNSFSILPKRLKAHFINFGSFKHLHLEKLAESFL